MEKSKKTILSASIAIFVLVFAIILIVSSFVKSNNNKDKYILNSEKYNLSFVSTIKDNSFTGDTLISSDDNNFTLNGTFVNGVFTNGYISILDGETSYYLQGDFEDFYLKEGTITIRTSDKLITKKGFFKENKLDGTGSMIIQSLSTNEILFTYAGKFKEDYPQY